MFERKCNVYLGGNVLKHSIGTTRKSIDKISKEKRITYTFFKLKVGQGNLKSFKHFLGGCLRPYSDLCNLHTSEELELINP